MNKEMVREWLVNYVATLLEASPQAIDPAAPFADYGLESGMTMGLVGELEEWLGYELPLSVLWRFPSIELLSENIHTMGEASSDLRSAQGITGVVGRQHPPAPR